MLNQEKQGDFNPKHRIVGAIILVAAAVILLPMILKDAPPGQEAPAAASPDVVETKTVVVPIPPVNAVPPPAEPESSTQSASSAPPLVVPPPPVMVDLRPEQNSDKPDPPKPQAKPPTKSAATKLTGYYVQVGTFSQPENARQLSEKLKKKGYKVQMENVTINRARVVRVRVGPYPRTADARDAQDDIRKAFDIKGVIGHY